MGTRRQTSGPMGARTGAHADRPGEGEGESRKAETDLDTEAARKPDGGQAPAGESERSTKPPSRASTQRPGTDTWTCTLVLLIPSKGTIILSLVQLYVSRGTDILDGILGRKGDNMTTHMERVKRQAEKLLESLDRLTPAERQAVRTQGLTGQRRIVELLQAIEDHSIDLSDRATIESRVRIVDRQRKAAGIEKDDGRLPDGSRIRVLEG